MPLQVAAVCEVAKVPRDIRLRSWFVARPVEILAAMVQALTHARSERIEQREQVVQTILLFPIITLSCVMFGTST